MINCRGGRKFMHRKIIGILVCMLLVGTVLPVTASWNINKEVFCKQEEKSNDDVYFVIMWINGFLRSYKELDKYYELDIKIAIAFIIGWGYGGPPFGVTLLRGIRAIEKKDFQGTLTQSRIIGKVIDLDPPT